MVHKPVEKNLKHKTDVLSWLDIPWEEFDLNFRPPSASQLRLTTAQAWGQLAVVAGVTAVALALGERWISQTVLRSVTGMEVCCVAVIMAWLTANRTYRPLPLHVCDPKRTSQYVGFGIVLSYATFRCMLGHRAFDIGIVLLFCLALPGCLLLADQWTSHMLHWLTSDPRIDRDELVLWRNAWCGRFLSDDVGQLKQLDVSETDVARLRRYWRAFAIVASIYLTSAISAILLAAKYRAAWSGIALVCLSTAMLALRTASVEGWSRKISERSAPILGQWFLYQKNEVQPAWVMPSPAGTQLLRTFQTYAAVCLVSAAFFFLLAGVPGLFRAVLVTVLAPLHCLAIGFTVSIPTLTSVEAGLGLVPYDDQEEAR